MERKQVMDILDKIQVYRQSFLVTQALIKEWSKILEPYDYEDVNKKLDDYFKDGNNFGKYPDVYYLTQYLKTQKQKQDDLFLHVHCQYCRNKIKYSEYAKHYERCISCTYLIEMSDLYFNKTLNREKLLNASQEQFDKYYWDFCKKLYDVLPDGDIKTSLKNKILHSHCEVKIND